MRIGIIGGGIVGTTVAATIQKLGLQLGSSSLHHVTLIDDLRDYQTSKAGYVYFIP